MEITNVVEVESQHQLETLISENKTVVVDFHALDWCQPCKKLHPHFVKTAESYTDSDEIVFAQVDLDRNAWATASYGIMSVPVVRKFEGGKATDLKGRTVIQLVNEIGG